MTIGLRIRLADGSIFFDSSNRLGKILGVVNTGTSDGSATFDFSGGEGFAIVTPQGGMLDLIFAPQWSVSGSTLSWTWNSAVPTDQRVNCVLLVGKY